MKRRDLISGALAALGMAAVKRASAESSTRYMTIEAMANLDMCYRVPEGGTLTRVSVATFAGELVKPGATLDVQIQIGDQIVTATIPAGRRSVSANCSVAFTEDQLIRSRCVNNPPDGSGNSQAHVTLGISS